MDLMDVVCLLVIIGIVYYVGFKIWETTDKKNQEYRRQVESVKNEFNNLKNDFDKTLANFFNSTAVSYHNTLANFFNSTAVSYHNTHVYLKDTVANMEKTNKKLKNLSKNDDYSGIISSYSKLADEFGNFGQRVDRLPYTCMMDSSNYGKIQKDYLYSIRSMNKSTVDTTIANYEKNIYSHSYTQIFAIDIEVVLRCVWFYAIDKPYSVESFKKAANVFNRLVKKPQVDVTIAELYAMKQMGGEDVLRDRIRNMLKSTQNAEKLTLIASALMWINAYQVENMILQHMLSAGMQMSAKTQERLHSLTNGGGEAPSGFDVASNNSEMYFDVSALVWKDEEYAGLFENLAFQEKILSYSLAVRDEDKDLFISNSISVPGTAKILTKLSSVFAEEYGSAVTAELKKCIALSGSGEEKMEGILVESNECKQMGILVHIARIGKKLNIKFYTLFMPSEKGPEDQKQQVLSLYKKLSPSVAMWESSMKETVLMAIQQLLNAESQTAFNGGNTADNGDGPIF